MRRKSQLLIQMDINICLHLSLNFSNLYYYCPVKVQETNDNPKLLPRKISDIFYFGNLQKQDEVRYFTNVNRKKDACLNMMAYSQIANNFSPLSKILEVATIIAASHC